MTAVIVWHTHWLSFECVALIQPREEFNYFLTNECLCISQGKKTKQQHWLPNRYDSVGHSVVAITSPPACISCTDSAPACVNATFYFRSGDKIFFSFLYASSPARQRGAFFLRSWLADLLLSNAVSSASDPDRDRSSLEALLIRSQAACGAKCHMQLFIKCQLTWSAAYSCFMFDTNLLSNIISAAILLLPPGHRNEMLFQLWDQCWNSFLGAKK